MIQSVVGPKRSASGRQRSATADLQALLFLAGACLLLFWPVWFADYRFPLGGGDLWGQLHPVWSYVATWLRRGIFPLWSTQMMAGDPIISELQYGLLNPLNWPLFLVNPIPGALISLRGVFSLWLAGAGCYLYLHHSPVWKVPRTAALMGALATMASDPFIVHLGHPQFNDTFAWLPWVLLGVDYATTKIIAVPFAGLALGLLLLAGHGQAALYAALFAGLYSLWRALDPSAQTTTIRTKHLHRLRSIGRLALTALVAACIAAPALIPALERQPYTERAIQPEGGSPEYEFQSAMWINAIAPHFHGRNIKGFWAPWDRVESSYIGVVALALAALGFVSGLHKRRTWFLIITGSLIYLFALGSQGPIYPLLAPLPFFSATWKTSRIVALLSLILSIGTALGVQTLIRTGKNPKATTLPVFAWAGPALPIFVWAGLILVGSLLLWWATPSLSADVPPGAFQAKAREGLHLAALFCAGTALLGLGAQRHSWGRAALLVLLLTELTTTTALADIEKRPLPENDPHTASIAYLKADQGWFRVDVDGKARGLWSPSAIMAAGFEVPQGTGNPMEIVAYPQFYWAIPTKGFPAYQLTGAKYIVVPKGALPGGDGIWPVFSDDPLIDIHLNTNAMTRVWLVTRTQAVASLEQAYGTIFQEEFTPSQIATVLNGPALNSQGTGSLEVLAYTPNTVAIQVRSTETALLVLSDLNYPGWKAWVDGIETPIITTNGLFRGIVITAGDHRIEMRYRPVSLRIGLGLLGMALLGIGMGHWMRSRKHATREKV